MLSLRPTSPEPSNRDPETSADVPRNPVVRGACTWDLEISAEYFHPTVMRLYAKCGDRPCHQIELALWRLLATSLAGCPFKTVGWFSRDD
jgi:hypothetical protein